MAWPHQGQSSVFIARKVCPTDTIPTPTPIQCRPSDSQLYRLEKRLSGESQQLDLGGLGEDVMGLVLHQHLHALHICAPEL